MDIKEKIKDYQLVPLFPSTEISDGYGFDIKDDLINFYSVRKKVSLSFMCMVAISKKPNGFTASYLYSIFKGLPDELPKEQVEQKDVVTEKANLPDIMNFYNEFYGECAKKFNEILTEKLKEDLEKEKEKQKEKEEQEKQEGESQESESGEGEESEEQESSESGEQGEESGEEGEGEGEGESSESGEQGEGEGGEMSSEDIQKMIEEIEKAQSGENQQGQSQSGSENIDLEDFLNEVENGNADNDFTKNYNNQELKSKIDYDKKEEQSEQQSSGQGSGKQNEFENYEVKDSLGAVKVLLEISTDEVKRRFPNKKAVSGFIASLSKEEIDTIASQVGIPQGISNVEKQKQISNNLAKEINI